MVWRRFGIGNVVELEVRSRRGTGSRRRLVGLLRVGDKRFIGHPNGPVGWTRDLDAAGGGTVRWPEGTDWQFTVTQLPAGDVEREQAILATGQHPFPGNLMYRLGRRHIRVVGVFFRLEGTQ